MSPEQARGERTIDASTDQYALCARVYETLCGEPPFSGPTVQAIIAKSLGERAVPLATLREIAPASIASAVLHPLHRLPADRWTSVEEFAQALASPPGGATDRLDPRDGTAGAGAGIARTPVAITNSFALSPDGTALVYSAVRSGLPQQLYLHHFDDFGATPITGTTGGTNPDFSPDGEWIAFFDGARLVKLPIEVGTPIPLATTDGVSPSPLLAPLARISGSLIAREGSAHALPMR